MMNREFLESVFGKSDKDMKLEDFSQENISLEGAGFATVLYRVTMRWSGPPTDEYPLRVICKIPSTEGTTFDNWADTLFGEDKTGKEDMMAGLRRFVADAHKTECTFYKHFTGTGAVPIPKVYFANADDADKPKMIIMEDLAPSGVVVSREDGLRLDQLLEVAEAIAKFHVYSLQNEDLKKHFPPLDEYMWIMVVQTFQQVAAGLSNQMAEFGEKLKRFEPYATAEFINKCVNSSEEMKVPSVLASLDVDLRNMFFAKDADQSNQGGRLLAIYDWQLAQIGQPAADLARMLLCSARSSLRRAEQQRVLSYYHAKLLEHLPKGMEEPFTLEQLQRCYNRILPFVVVFFLINVADSLHRAKGTEKEKSVAILIQDALDALDDCLVAQESLNK